MTGRVLGRRVRVLNVAPILSAVLVWWADSTRRVADFRAMFDFFATGRYVADTERQGELFGPVPTAESAVTRWAGRTD